MPARFPKRLYEEGTRKPQGASGGSGRTLLKEPKGLKCSFKGTKADWTASDGWFSNVSIFVFIRAGAQGWPLSRGSIWEIISVLSKFQGVSSFKTFPSVNLSRRARLGRDTSNKLSSTESPSVPSELRCFNWDNRDQCFFHKTMKILISLPDEIHPACWQQEEKPQAGSCRPPPCSPPWAPP